jgi:tryptophanyl-tRNA synthetase
MLEPIRERRKLYSSDPAELDRILKDGADRASAMAEATMQIVRETMKFI